MKTFRSILLQVLAAGLPSAVIVSLLGFPVIGERGTEIVIAAFASFGVLATAWTDYSYRCDLESVHVTRPLTAAHQAYVKRASRSANRTHVPSLTEVH